jgi:hypothetical protein
MIQSSDIVLRYDTLGSSRPSGLWLLFDVTLKNSADRARWFVLPSHVDADDSNAEPRPFSVLSVDVWRLNARASIPCVHFIGSEGFQAFLLPPHAAVHVRRLPIVWYGEPPRGTTAFRCAAADDITIEGESAAGWIPVDVTSPVSADADYEERDLIASRATASNTEQPVTLIGVRPIDVATHVILER